MFPLETRTSSMSRFSFCTSTWCLVSNLSCDAWWEMIYFPQLLYGSLIVRTWKNHLLMIIVWTILLSNIYIHIYIYISLVHVIGFPFAIFDCQRATLIFLHSEKAPASSSEPQALHMHPSLVPIPAPSPRSLLGDVTRPCA